MINTVEEKLCDCPYCGEQIQLLIDCSVENQSYIEDCQVCCRPINITVFVSHQGEIDLRLASEDE